MFQQGTISAGTTYSGQKFYPDIAIAPNLTLPIRKEGMSPTTLTFSVIKLLLTMFILLSMKCELVVMLVSLRLALLVLIRVYRTLDDGYMAAPALL